MDYLQIIIVLLLIFVVIFAIMDHVNMLRRNVFKELFTNYYTSRYSSDIPLGNISAQTSIVDDLKHYDINPTYNGESAVPSLDKIEGGMANLDGLDGSGSGPVYSNVYTEKMPKFNDLSGAIPDGSLGPDGGFGPDKSTFRNGGPIKGLPDNTLGVVPLLAEDTYPTSIHGIQIYKHDTSTKPYGDPHIPYTYYYLENDNINQPCKLNSDCKNSKCSESGFCRY